MKKSKHIQLWLPVASLALLGAIMPASQALAYYGRTATAITVQQAVTGKVTGTDGNALAGVSIQIKGTNTGTISDADGHYALEAKAGDVLQISFVGYADKTITLGAQTTLDIVLEQEAGSLGDVVVIGFGTQKKKAVTGAISTVSAKDMENQQVTRFDDALRGRAAGVTVVQSSGQPGSAPTIRVRGVTSINNSDPLYVIDGITVDNGGYESLNPDDIATITVLKDASAAIYGARASNGVVIVTTKKGMNGAPKFSYNGYYGIQNPIKRVKLANAEQYATLRNQSLINDGKDPAFDNPAQYGSGTDWQDVIFKKNTPMQNHNFSVSGGSDKGTYYASFGILDQKGLVMPDVSSFKRMNFALNSTYKIRPWLTIGENFSYSYSKTEGIDANTEFGGPLADALNLDPITPVVITDMNSVDPGMYSNQFIIRNAQGQPYGISPYVNQEIVNPAAFVQTIRGNYNWSHNILANGYIEIQPIKGLTIKSSLSAKQAFFGNESFTPKYYLSATRSNTTSSSGGRASNQNFTWNWDNTASYEYATGLHNFMLLVGTSAQKESGMSLSGNFIGFPINDYRDLSFNFGLPSSDRVASAGDDQPYSLSSIFGRLTYNYDEKYLFSGVIRRDGSSKFGSNNVYGYFPSAELGWVLSKENFLANSNSINFLKLRASYGILGNERPLTPFQYAATIGSGRNYVFGNDELAIGYSPNAPANPDLKWEQTASTDIGIDVILFKHFNLTADYYNKETKGMLQTVKQPYYAGYNGNPWQNVGNLVNKGFELMLGYNNNFGDFNLNASGNISYNHNEVTYLGSTPYYTSGSFQNMAAPQRTQVGQPVNAFYGYHELGVFHSQNEINNYKNSDGVMLQPNAKPGDFKWEDIDGNGSISDNDRTFLGSNLPTWTYGFSLNANYKHFDFLIFGQGVWGNKVFQGYRRLDITKANYGVEALDAWSVDNPNGNYPRLSDDDPNQNFKNMSNFRLQSGAYFRIKTLQLGYTLPAELTKKATLEKVRFYISANNLITVTKYNGLDPEVSGSIDKGVYPQARTWSFGLNITL
ncbi:MAG TPA: TonB-dependent receptor [Arachidicoccus sp.]|nr:TonB-dependent receptor [Arachidicoccus sp.]